MSETAVCETCGGYKSIMQRRAETRIAKALRLLAPMRESAMGDINDGEGAYLGYMVGAREVLDIVDALEGRNYGFKADNQSLCSCTSRPKGILLSNPARCAECGKEVQDFK